jgi:uncharacterized membrane protein YraQ (UPF0718 family)
MNLPEPSQTGDFYVAFLSILLEGAPFILLGTVISGFIHAYLPANLFERLLPKAGVPAVLVSGLLGAILPVCECAIVPVIRRLVRKGLPLGCAVTYMLSAPIVNPVVVLSTVSAFAGQAPGSMALSRVSLGYCVAVLAGLVVSRLGAARVLRGGVAGPAGEAAHDHGALTGQQKLVVAMRTAMRDMLDTGMYFTIGVLITAVVRSQFSDEALLAIGQNAALAVPGMMLFAFVLSLCSTTDAFIVAQIAGISRVAKLAFLTYGPMMDMKLIFLYSSVFRKRFVLGMVFALAAAVGGLSLLWQALGFPG